MKKLTLFGILFALVLTFSALSVDAQLSTTTTYNKDNPNFGDENQEASNPKHDDEEKYNIYVTSTINLDNSGNISVKIQSIKINPTSGFTVDDLKIEAVGTLPTIAANGKGDIQLKARISEDLNAVDDKFEPIAFKVATVDLLDDSTPAKKVGEIEVWMQRENQLEIKDVDAIINGKGKQSIDDDDQIDNLKPGDKIELEIQAENNYDDDTNLDIENVKVKIECDNEDGFDFDDKTQDLGDIGTEDEETDSITFDIEDDAEDDTTKCTLLVEGKDENGAEHGQQIEFGVEVVRKNHDIVIKGLTATPSTLNCDDNSISLRVDLINLGKSDEDRVAIEVISKLLGFQERISNFELDEDDTDEKVFIISVDPRKIKQGPFVIQVQTFYDNTKLSDTDTITLENLCSEAEPVGTGNQKKIIPKTTEALTVSSEIIEVTPSGFASIPVKVTNKEDVQVEYTVSIINTEEFAESASTKTVFLNPGQTSTVLLNLKIREDAEAGMYSGTIVLKNDKGSTLETETFTTEVSGEAVKKANGFTFFTGDTNSKIFWIIGDIILIIVAIFFIKLIFTGGKKKSRPKKMADYEAETRTRRR